MDKNAKEGTESTPELDKRVSLITAGAGKPNSDEIKKFLFRDENELYSEYMDTESDKGDISNLNLSNLSQSEAGSPQKVRNAKNRI